LLVAQLTQQLAVEGGTAAAFGVHADAVQRAHSGESADVLVGDSSDLGRV
jgi:hypothetical protein